MVYVRGNRQNYDDWEAEGCKGWGFADALRCFKRYEDWEGGENEYRGAGGPVRVTASKDLTPASQGLLQAIAETCGVSVLDDYNGASQEGVGPCQMNARGGRRYGSSEAYLQPALARPNFHIEIGAVVARIVLEKNRAIGVELLDGRRAAPRSRPPRSHRLRGRHRLAASAAALGDRPCRRALAPTASNRSSISRSGKTSTTTSSSPSPSSRRPPSIAARRCISSAGFWRKSSKGTPGSRAPSST